MERCEPPRARRAGARRRRRRRPLADWLRDIARVASQHRAAGYHAVKLHGVLIVFRHTREVQHAGDGRGHQRTVGDAPTASSAKPEQLSKRKQSSSMRLADFRRRMEQRDQAAASKLRRLWSVVWLQRLVRRRLGERSRLAAGVAIVGEPGADAGLQKAKAGASEACVAPVGSAATFRAAAVAAPKRKVGSGAEVSPAKAVARLGALSTSPAARPEAAEMVVAARRRWWRRRRVLRRRGRGGWTSAPRCRRLSGDGLTRGRGYRRRRWRRQRAATTTTIGGRAAGLSGWPPVGMSGGGGPAGTPVCLSCASRRPSTLPAGYDGLIRLWTTTWVRSSSIIVST